MSTAPAKSRDGTPITQEAGGVQLVLDPELTFRLLPGHTAPGISINADGFRGPPLRPRGEAFRVLLTGGLARSGMLVRDITAGVRALGCGVTAYPGENEMYALVKGALRVFNGREVPGVYDPDRDPEETTS